MRLAVLLGLVGLACVTTAASSEETRLVSRSVADDTPLGYTQWPLMSADGAWVVLAATSPLDVPGLVDVNGHADVYLVERATGVIRLVSHAAGSELVAGNGDSYATAVSADGRYVLFGSQASDLIVPGVASSVLWAVFQWDRDTGMVSLVSHAHGALAMPADGISASGVMSADGGTVAFSSNATNLLAEPLDDRGQTYVWARASGAVRLISHLPGTSGTGANGRSYPVAVSADGRQVVFTASASDLIAGGVDANGDYDAFLWDADRDEVRLISHRPGARATTGRGWASPQSISADGRHVAFLSTARDLVAGGQDTPNSIDAFVWDRDTARVSLLSHEAGSNRATGSESYPFGISADGRYVAFRSDSMELAGGIHGKSGNVFLWDRSDGAVRLISHVPGAPSRSGEQPSWSGHMSPDGRFVTFSSGASNLVADGEDSNGLYDAFVWDRLDGVVRLLSHRAGSPLATGNSGSYASALSADGSVVVITSLASDLASGIRDLNGTADVFWTDVGAAELHLLSRASAALPSGANREVAHELMTPDGRYVVYETAATNLISDVTDTNQTADVFFWDRVTSTTRLISHALGADSTAADDTSYPAAISADGRFVAFGSYARNLVPGGDGRPGAYLWERESGQVRSIAAGAGTAGMSADGRFVLLQSAGPRGIQDVRLWDRETGKVRLVSHALGAGRRPANGTSVPIAVSADGRRVTFWSYATDLVGAEWSPGFAANAFVWKREDGKVRLVSHAADSVTKPGNAASVPVAISADGRYVAFQSSSTDLVAGGEDANQGIDAFLWDEVTERVILVSHAHARPAKAGNGWSAARALSADGRYLALSSRAGNLVADAPATDATEAFEWDRETGITRLVSHVVGDSAPVAAYSEPSAISADGRLVAFSSTATNLVAGVSDANDELDAFLWDRDSGTVRLASLAADSSGKTANGGTASSALSADGRYLLLSSRAPNLIRGDLASGWQQVYLWAADVVSSDDFELGKTGWPMGHHAP